MRTVLLLSALVALAHGSAAGQQPDDPAADTTRLFRVYELGAVEVVANREGRTPGTVSAPIETIREHGRRDLAEALELLPGVSASGFGARNESMVTVRGFDLRQVPVFMDGVPVYVPYDGYVDLGRFTVYDAAEVRVSRGFSSVLYGPNAMGGAINVLSRRPVEALEIDVGSGAFTGEGREAWVNAGSRFGPGYVQASASMLEQDDFRLPSGGPSEARDNSDRRDLRGSLKLGWVPSERSEVALSLASQRGRKGVPPYAGSDPQERRRFWRWPEWNKSGASLVARTAVGTGATIQGRAYYDTFDNTLLSFDDDTYSTQTRPSSFRSVYDDYTVGGSVELGLRPDGAHVPRVAFHLKEDTHREHNAGEPVRTFRDRTLSAGLEHTWRAREAMSLVAGASLERRETLQADDFVAGEVQPFPTADGTSFNPQVGLFRTLGVGTLRATASRKTRFPTIKDRYSYRMGTALPNPELDSESATHLELGYAGEVRGVSVDLSAFDAEIDDLIQQVDSVARNGAGGYLWQFQNVGRARRWGADLALAGRPVAWATLGGSYSYLHHENLESPDVRLTGVPRHRGYGYIRVDPARWLDVLASVDAYGRRYASSSGLELPGFATVDLRLAARPRQEVEVSVGTRNLLDHRYELTSGFPEPGRTIHVNASYTLAGGRR